jgi:hypothetical protein
MGCSIEACSLLQNVSDKQNEQATYVLNQEVEQRKTKH